MISVIVRGQVVTLVGVIGAFVGWIPAKSICGQGGCITPWNW